MAEQATTARTTARAGERTAARPRGREARELAAAIVRDAGGEIVGRTRVQKIGYLLELAGLGSGFRYAYKHYGPYSDDLTQAMRSADVFGLVEEEERVSDWGGLYSIFRLTVPAHPDPARNRFVHAAARTSPIELELAATAAYLHVARGYPDPWAETRRRKPQKAADGRLAKAKRAYERLRAIKTPIALPDIPGTRP